MLPSSIPGTAIGIGASATTTTRPTGRSATVCLTIILTGAHLIMDTLGGDTITTIIRRAITAIITTIPTAITTGTATIIITVISTAAMPAHTTASTTTTCLIPTDTGRAAQAATAAALTPAIPTMAQAAVLAT